MKDFDKYADWSTHLIAADQRLIAITDLMNDKRYEEADALISEVINLMSQTRGWILHNRGK